MVREVPEIRFNNFNDTWQQLNLGDVLDNLYNGQTPSRAQKSYWDGTINWLTSGELNRGIVLDTIEKITDEGKRASNLKIVPKGTFVMAITGLEAAGTRGNCAKLGIDTTLNQSCMALFPNEKLLNSSFLFQWYRKVGEKYGLQYTQGTKQQSYNAQLIKILPINLPSIKEQMRISKYIETLDENILLHKHALDLLKQRKKAFLQKMLPRKGQQSPEIRFNGFSDEWKKDVLGSYLKIPEKKTATVKKIDDLITLKLNLEGMFGGSKRTTLKLGSTKYYERRAGQFLYGKQNFFNGSMGIIPPELDKKATSGDVPALDIINIDTNFLYTYVSRSEYWKSKEAYSIGTGSKRIHEKTLQKFEISVPSLEEQEKIGNFFEELNNSITLQEEKLESLKQMKKAFLQKMFV